MAGLSSGQKLSMIQITSSHFCCCRAWKYLWISNMFCSRSASISEMKMTSFRSVWIGPSRNCFAIWSRSSVESETEENQSYLVERINEFFHQAFLWWRQRRSAWTEVDESNRLNFFRIDEFSSQIDSTHVYLRILIVNYRRWENSTFDQLHFPVVDSQLNLFTERQRCWCTVVARSKWGHDVMVTLLGLRYRTILTFTLLIGRLEW